MVMSGAMATAGDLVFYGTTDGWFRAADARTGKVLWSQKLGSGIIGQPMTYTGPDKRQYVAVAAGVGGAAMVQKSRAGFPARGNTLYVFSLNGDTIQAPESPPRGATAPAVCNAAMKSGGRYEVGQAYPRRHPDRGNRRGRYRLDPGFA